MLRNYDTRARNRFANVFFGNSVSLASYAYGAPDTYAEGARNAIIISAARKHWRVLYLISLSIGSLLYRQSEITAVSALSERLCPSPFELWMHMPVGLVIRAAKAGHNLRAAVFHTGILIGAGQHVEAHFLLLRSYPISPKTAVLSKGAFCHFGKEPRHQLIQTRYLHCPSDF